MNAGQALTDAILGYYQTRQGDTGTTARILVRDLPSQILEEAARSLVRSSRPTSDGKLVFEIMGSEFEIALALIQSEDDLAERGILEENGFEFGTSTDHPVALRNRVGDVLVLCPPELFESCHESIKTNTFQEFHTNRQFGSQTSILRRLRSRIIQDHNDRDGETWLDDATRLSYIADTKLVDDRTYGDRIWSETWSAIDSCYQTEEVDTRQIGLLPSRELQAENAADLRPAVRANINFQIKLIEGLE